MLQIQVCMFSAFFCFGFFLPLNSYCDKLISISRFVKILVIEIFSSVLGLFGLIIGLLVSGKATEFS